MPRACQEKDEPIDLGHCVFRLAGGILREEMGCRCTNRMRTIRIRGLQHENNHFCFSTLDRSMELGLGGCSERRASQEAAQVEETRQAKETREFYVRRNRTGPIFNISNRPACRGCRYLCEICMKRMRRMTATGHVSLSDDIFRLSEAAPVASGFE